MLEAGHRHRRRSSPRALVALLSLVAACPVVMLPRTAQGQVQAQAQASPAGPPANLAAALGQVDWNPEERGALLIVAPERATMPRPRPERQADGSLRMSTPPVWKPAGPEGSYRLTVIDSYFGRKLTQVGGLWAVVPETMTVLNSTRLPEPDPYMGMSQEQKMRLLQSRLTEAQWKKVASPQGIGANDLDAEQRNLFLSALPDPFRVQVIRANPEGGIGVERVTLSPAQRSGVRIAMRRQLSWSFAYENQANGSVSIGVGGGANPDGSPRLTLAQEFEDWEARRRKMLDVALVEEVPNHLKEGDVHFASPALNALVPIADAKTVGELVQRVAKAARVELYADPRYADLAVHVRAGGGVRAGDVLQALCLSVTGTVRKVDAGAGAGVAYVLTDDREGLAVRQARIARWLRRSGRLIDEREKGVSERLTAAKPIDHLPWSPGDPMTPDGALLKKIEAHREQASKPRDPAQRLDYYSRYPMIPVGELPAAAREMVQKQLESWSGNNFGGEPQKLRTDAVRLDVRASTVLIVPGMGTVEGQSGFGGFGGAESLFGSIQDRVLPSAPAARPKQEEVTLPVSLPAQLADRYLFVRAATADEAKRAAAAAKERGLTALWLEAPVGMSPGEFGALVTAARGAVPGLRVFAVVRALRLGAADQAAAGKVPADVNLLGETSTVTAARRAKELPAAPVDRSSPDFYYTEEAARPVRSAALGDYPSLARAEGRAAVRRRVLEIARTPGVSGVVLRDLAPPGYVGTEVGFAVGNSLQVGGYEFDLGYSPEMRLAFLRAHGVDPLDIGPLGDENLWMGGRFGGGGGMPGSIALPFFRNYGPGARSATYNGKSAIELGAKDAGERWSRFRQQLAVEFQNDLFKALQGVTGPEGKPLTLLREVDMPAFQGAWRIMAWDKPVEMPPAPASPGGPPSPQQQRQQQQLQASRWLWTISPAEALAFVPEAEKDLPAADRFGLRIGRMAASLAAPPPPRATTTTPTKANPANRTFRPIGMLIDLSELPVDEALPLLGQIRPPAPGKPAAPTRAPAR